MERKQLSASWVLMMGLGLTMGCGGDVGERKAALASAGGETARAADAPGAPRDSGEAAPDSGAGGARGMVSPSCPGATHANGAEIVAAGISGTDLVLVTARGDKRLAASFDPSDAGGLWAAARVLTGDGRVTASLGQQTIRLDASFQVLYHLPAFADFASDAGIVDSSHGPTHFVRADGTSVTFADASGPLSVFFLRAPDTNGWMLGAWSSETAAQETNGLLNADGRLQPYFADDSAASRARLAGQDVFLHGVGPFTLTFATDTKVIDVPVNVPNTPGSLPTSLYIAGSSKVGIVTSASDPRLFRVDGVARTIVPIDVPPDVASAVSAGLGGSVIVSADGATFVGVDSKARPAWTYDANTSKLAAVSLATLSPLRPLDGGYCNMPMVAVPGGRIAMGLRDDAVAGFYLVASDGSASRVGRPVRDIVGMNAVQVASTWVVTANSGHDSYCPPFTPFTPAPLDASVVSGNSVQVVPRSAAPLVFTAEDEWAMGITEVAPTGLCLFREDAGGGTPGSLYDLETGAATELGTFRSFAWLP